MRDAFNFRSHVSLLAGNLRALPSQGSMAFRLPSFGLFERTKRSSAFNDFPQFSWSHLLTRRRSAEEVLGVCLLRKEGMESRARNTFILKGSSNPEIAAPQKYRRA